jgi:hypothetical protein
LENTFNKFTEDSVEKKKNISGEVAFKLKDIILDFVVLLKNSLKNLFKRN